MTPGPYDALELTLWPCLKSVFIYVLSVLKRVMCLALGSVMFDTCPFRSCLALSVSPGVLSLGTSCLELQSLPVFELVSVSHS